MAIAGEKPRSEGKVWGLFNRPFRPTTHQQHHQQQQQSSSSSSAMYNYSTFATHHTTTNTASHGVDGSNSSTHSNSSVSSIAKSFLLTRRRLRLEPSTKLYFPYEPGKQVRSAVSIKNTSKSHVAFKFQTTSPKSCFMRPPGAILAPGESLIATVFKFVEAPENNEKPLETKRKVKFKIMSLKVKGPMDYVPELFDEQKDRVAIERILQVVFLDVNRPSPALEKLNRMLAEAEAEVEARKKAPEDNGPKIIGEGLVIDEWKERRERYLARQQVEGADSL